jgi:hypothetical protein
MIPARKLLPPEAFFRYDQDGEPLLYAHERVLLALAKFDYDWVSGERIREAMEVDGAHATALSAAWTGLVKLVEEGRVEMIDGTPATRQYRLSRDQPAFKEKREPTRDEEGNAIPKHADMTEAEKSRQRRKERKQAGLCLSCTDRAVPGRTRCEACRQRDAERARARWQNKEAA